MRVLIEYEDKYYIATEDARINCSSCSAKDQPFCKAYSNGKGNGALCNILSSIILGKSGSMVFKEVTK